MVNIVENDREVNVLVPSSGSDYEKVLPKTVATAVLDSSGNTVQSHISDSTIHVSQTSITSQIGTAIENLEGGVSSEYDTLGKIETAIGAINDILAVVDHDDLDTLEEIVTFILDNKDVIDSLVTDKVNYTDIVNNLTTVATQTNKTLDARQGKVLKDYIDGILAVLAQPWESSHDYVANALVIRNNRIYICTTAHTSGNDFDTDLAAGKWISPSADVFTGATAIANGTSGLVPAPLIADKDKWLKGSGAWSELPSATSSVKGMVQVDGTTISASNGVISAVEMTGANLTTNGTSGIVPAPTSADVNKFLKGDGDWATYPIATLDEPGIIKPDGNRFSVNAAGTLQWNGGSTTIVVDTYTITSDNTTTLTLTQEVSDKTMVWVNIDNTDLTYSEFSIGNDNRSIVLSSALNAGDFGHVKYFTTVDVSLAAKALLGNNKTVTVSTIPLDLNTAYYTKEVSTASTIGFTIGTIEANKAIEFNLHLNLTSAVAVSFASNIKWLDNTPTINTAKHYLLKFRSFDGGITFVGNLEGSWS